MASPEWVGSGHGQGVCPPLTWLPLANLPGA